MAYIPVVLIHAKYAANTVSAEYTSTNAISLITAASATNVSGADATLTVHLVRNSETASASNVVIDAREIAPGECYICPEVTGHILADGDFIAIVASAASAIVVRMSGVAIT